MTCHVSQEDFPAVFESIDDGILVVDDANKITLYNPQFTKMWSIPTELIQERDDEKTLNYIFEQLIDPAEFIKKVRDLYRSELECKDLIRFKDGRVFERHSSPLKIDNARPGRVWFFRDITDNVNTNLELKVYKNYIEKLVSTRTEELEKANSRLEAFNYTASHDLRAPLRSIEGFSNILLEDYQDSLDERGKEYLQTITDSVKQMRTLIDNLLKLSKVTHNNLSCQTIDLGEIVNNILKRLQKNSPERQLRIDISLGMRVFADPELLNIAIENLIENAWKYSANQKETFIKVDSYIDDGETIFFIKDNGIGFDMSSANEIFTPFKRLHTEQKFAGSGVGLATVQRIILQHNGKIWAEAEPHNGATFYFTLSVPHQHYVTH